MRERTILAEAAAELLAADRVDSRTCPDHLIRIFRDDCEDCQRETRELAALVLRVAERRIREQAGEPKTPILASNGHDFAVLGKHYAADLIAEGLPVEYQANGQEG